MDALRIAFGDFPDWEEPIRANLAPRYTPEFISLDGVDLEAFDAVAPLRREHYSALARRPDLFGRKFIHPTPAAADLCHDKLSLTRFLIASGFADFTPALRGPGPPYPYIWKRRHGAWGRDCHVVSGPGDEAGIDLSDPEWFAQELVLGPVEFAAHALRVNGELRYGSTFGYEMAGATLVRGARHAPVRQGFDRVFPFAEVFGAMLSRLGYEGTACFNYKLRDGRPLIFENNPRYGASLNMDVTAYIDAYVQALAD